MSSALQLILDALTAKSRTDLDYWIPRLWLTHEDMVVLEETDTRVKVEPCSYFVSAIRNMVEKYPHKHLKTSLSRIQGLKVNNGRVLDNGVNRLPGDWMAASNMYGLYMRSFSAFDHDGDGTLGGSAQDISLNSQGMRETGTFLKAMALLPYIKNLGFDTVYLLPVSLSGEANRKGELGSPYSQRNPFKLDPIYHDPILNELPLELQFRGFVEAAHALDIRVILDSVPRIAARDSEFVLEHPDWFYWIRRDAEADYHSPAFTKEELSQIHNRVKNKKEFNGEMIPPHTDYRELFYPAPRTADIRHIPGQGYIGKSGSTEVVVPGAFADWPPDDIQPPWTDVSYLRLYEDKDYDYVAYNTIRMYDSRIKKKNLPLWDSLARVIPYYQETFGIDGARIDMGHALPRELEDMIISSARDIDPDFGFMCENFNAHAVARPQGYNVVMGNAWWMLHRWDTGGTDRKSYMKEFLADLKNIPNPILGSPETADTPRAASRRGGIRFSRAAWILATTLPNFVPFCTAGFDLGDTHPSNLGLDFTSEEIAVLSKKPLAFFSRAALDWESPFAKELNEHIAQVNAFRSEQLGTLLHLDNFQWIDNEVEGHSSFSVKNPVVSYFRNLELNTITILTSGIFGEQLRPIDIEQDILIVVNMDCENEVISSLQMDSDMELEDIYTGEHYKTVKKELNLRLKPGESILAVRL